jgi:hypothetical protein
MSEYVSVKCMYAARMYVYLYVRMSLRVWIRKGVR